MSIRYLYEFDFNNLSTQRIVQGESVQTETYIWRGVDLIEESDYYLNVSDSTGDFSTYISSNSISKLFVTRYSYNEETGITEEMTKSLYTEVSSDSTNSSFRQCSIPEEQLEDAQKLLADGIVQLYEIELTDPVTREKTYLHLKADNSISWNGFDWTGIPMLFEGYSSAQGNSYARPMLSIANPDGAFSTFVRDGFLDRAVVNRYFVLYDDIVNNRIIYQKKTWIIWFIKTLNKNMIQVELRNPMDGVNFDVPARMYIPPEFPFVTLK